MPITRSSTRLVATTTATSSIPSNPNNSEVKSTSRKRKPEASLEENVAKKITKKKSATTAAVKETSQIQVAVQTEKNVSTTIANEDTSFVPAVLTFNLEEARDYLIQVDHRFEDLFDRMKCKPFENLEQVHPFR